MREYEISVPMMAVVHVSVIAANKKDAIKKALEIADIKNASEAEAHKIIVDGNVFYGILNEIEISDIKDN